MGAEFDHINSYKEFGVAEIGPETPKQVFQLAEKVLLPIIENNNGTPYSHIIVATTCPDALVVSILCDTNRVGLRSEHANTQFPSSWADFHFRTASTLST